MTLAPPRGFSRAQLEEAPDSGEQLAAPGHVAFPGSSTRASRMRSQRFELKYWIDRELVYQAASGARFDPDPARWLALRDAGDARPVFGRRPAMLELKFDGSAPRWMVELVRCFNLQREAYSKYVAAVRQLRGRT